MAGVSEGWDRLVNRVKTSTRPAPTPEQEVKEFKQLASPQGLVPPAHEPVPQAAETGPMAEPFKLRAKPEGKHETLADVLDFVCEKYGCTYERTRKDGQVLLTLCFADGERAVGKGKDNAEALRAVRLRIGDRL